MLDAKHKCVLFNIKLVDSRLIVLVLTTLSLWTRCILTICSSKMVWHYQSEKSNACDFTDTYITLILEAHIQNINAHMHRYRENWLALILPITNKLEKTWNMKIINFTPKNIITTHYPYKKLSTLKRLSPSHW